MWIPAADNAGTTPNRRLVASVSPIVKASTRQSFKGFEHGISLVHAVWRFGFVFEFKFKLHRTFDRPRRELTDAHGCPSRGFLDAFASLIVREAQRRSFAGTAFHGDGFGLGLQ